MSKRTTAGQTSIGGAALLLAALIVTSVLSGCGGGTGEATQTQAPASTPISATPSPVGIDPPSSSGSLPPLTTAPPGTPVTPASPLSIALPIEVLGDGSPESPKVASTQIAVDGAVLSQVAQLAVTCHRCGFYNAPEFEALSKPITKVAASFRVVGGDAAGSASSAGWIDVADNTVKLADPERAQGGVNGAFLTIHFSVPLDAPTRARLVASPATNRLEFRFNGTDGNSNGFRILDVQFRDSAGKDLVTMPKQWADVAGEKLAGRIWTSDADKGQVLWSATNILTKSSIVPTKLRAACASCHASDGRDIQYFNYSDNAVLQRSQFHGLSTIQGQQILAYLRASLYARVPHVAAASPWNPPYQPGPGLDAKPIAEWAAGAGLEAVLPDAKTFLQAFVGRAATSTAAITQSDLDAVMDPSPGKVLNTREMPVPLQFPDWNAWLPTVHPLDVWTPTSAQTAGLFETLGDAGSNPGKIFQRDADWLKANVNPNGVYGDWSHLTPAQRQQAQSWLNDLGGSSNTFIGGGRGSRQSPDPTKPYGGELGATRLQARMAAKTVSAVNMPAAFTTPAFVERAIGGMIHWMGVKQWELAHTYGLEGQQGWFNGSRASDGSWAGVGEKRGWPFSWPSVFYIAPHMLYTQEGNRDGYFAWETRLPSAYRTNQWYQLQMTVNPGWPGASMGPMDWPYHMVFTTGVADNLVSEGAPAAVVAPHLMRFFQVRTKLAQLANTDIPFNQPDATQPNNLYWNKGIQSKADLVNHKLGVGEVVDRGPDPSERTRFRQLDTVMPGLHLMFINSSISIYNKLYADTSYAQWRRCDPNASFSGDPVNDPESKSGFRFCLDSQRTPQVVNSNGQPHLVGGLGDWTTEQYITWSIISAGNHGAEATRLKTMSDWDKRMWP